MARKKSSGGGSLTQAAKTLGKAGGKVKVAKGLAKIPSGKRKAIAKAGGRARQKSK